MKVTAFPETGKWEFGCAPIATFKRSPLMKMNMSPYSWLRQLVVVAAYLLALAFLAGLASAQQIIAINSGGPAASPFVADVNFSGGATIDHANTINTSKVTNPAPAAVYQSARIATTTSNGVTSFTYTIPGLTPGTNYLVRLHFCETFFTTTGSRVFNVSINGTPVLTNFDIVAVSGGQNIANVQQFTEAANASGQFVITFTSVTNNALVSGIEIDQIATSTPCQGTCIDSGSTTAVSPFVADMDFSGGATINHANTINTSKVTNPAPAAVYQSARIATTTSSGVTSFTYTIPGFTPGTNYLVRLHFCETFFTTAGSRVFNVSINGMQVLTNFDIAAASGGENIANIQEFTKPANSSGQFVITFTSVTNNALISGIEINPVTTGSCSIPTAPSGLSASVVSSSQIDLSWTASSSSCAVTYDVFRSTTSGFTPSGSNQIASGVSSTSFSDTGLAASTTYFYVVKGANSGGTSAASNQASATTQGAGGGNGPKLFAPYNDMSLTVSENIVTTAQNAGLKAITLAFLVGNGSCAFGWGGLGGTLPTDNEPNGTTVQSLVHQMQANGVTVIISFGGANGAIVNGCTNASALQAGLQEVLTRYGVNMLDFDMEASDTLGDGPGLPLLDQALKGLKAANPNLVVSFTLPVLPTGLISSGTAVLNQAHKDGFNPNVINVMAMDYGSSVDNGGQMGLDATLAAQAVDTQIQQAGLSSSVGITVMIGQNDTGGEIFQLNDVNTVLMFANSNSYVTRLSFWSLARDNGGCPGQKLASPTCSGIAQNTYQFSQSFEPF
jgi:hypothetical protein